MNENLNLATDDRKWSLLVRHATRPEIPTATYGNDLSITTEGRQKATELGQLLKRRLGRVVTSPVIRCVQTAESILFGSRAIGAPIPERALGDPGVWITDREVVGDIFLKLGPEGVVKRQVAEYPLPGITPLNIGVSRLLDLMLAAPSGTGLIDVFVSHDAVIAPLLYVALDAKKLSSVWPQYLEGALFSCEDDNLEIIWRGERRSRKWGSIWQKK